MKLPYPNSMAAIVLAVLIAFPAPAHAYIDPGTGSFLLQILTASVVGMLFYLRSVRDYILGLFRRKPPEDRSRPTDE